MKKICFIAQFPPPMHGLSKAVETLYNSNLNFEIDSQGEFEFEKVDITNNKNFIKNLLKISRSKADLFYFTISQTKGGNLRDLVIFKLLELQHKKCLIHLHGGYYRQLVDNDMAGWQRKANYKAIKKLSGAIVLSNSLKKIFEGMIDDDRIFVVENCVDDQYLLTDQEIEEKLKALENEKVLHVLWLSNFIRSKGYSFVLEMAKAEKERVDAGGEKRFHFDFAGKFFEDSEKDYFESYTNNEVRYRDWQNLKYWFRAVEKYAPWVRKIHFVTCGQKPEWLNINHPKLNLVDHKDYIDEKYLPTFSSHVIELNLHRIPDLTEKFVYFNDDMFLNDYVKPEDFFSETTPKDCAVLNTIKMDREGIPHIIVNNLCVLSDYFDFKLQFKKNLTKWINPRYGKYMLRTLFLLPWKEFAGFYELHTPYSYLKETFREVWEKEEKYLEEVCEHKFRDDKDVNQWLMRYWQLANGNFVPRSPDFGKMYIINDDTTLILKDIEMNKHKTICINDSSKISNFEKTKSEVLRAFEKKFPQKSNYEL